MTLIKDDACPLTRFPNSKFLFCECCTGYYRIYIKCLSRGKRRVVREMAAKSDNNFRCAQRKINVRGNILVRKLVGAEVIYSERSGRI
jgi:hypothetical protein